MSDWQPIETAPKEDIRLEWWCGPSSKYAGSYDGPIDPTVLLAGVKAYIHFGKRKTWGSLHDATHWRYRQSDEGPLPDPPKEVKP